MQSLLMTVWDTITSPPFLVTLLEKTGLVLFHPSDGAGYKLRLLYVLGQHTAIIFLICTHLRSTLWRSIRYLPEFFQALFEDVGMTLVYVQVLVLCASHSELKSLVQHIEFKFSKADPAVISKCRKQAGRIFLTMFVIMASVLLACISEIFTPFPEQELSIQRWVYRTQHPERRHTTHIFIPGVDDSKSWAYEIIVLFNFYMLIVFLAMTCSTVTLLPILVVHVKGQYEMLSQKIVQLGTPVKPTLVVAGSIGNTWMSPESTGVANVFAHSRYNAGNRLFLPQGRSQDTGDRSFLPQGRSRTQKQLDERQQLRNIVLFHHQLVDFQDKMMIFCRPIILLIIIVNIASISLCVYQITVRPKDLPTERLIKFLAEMIVVMLQLFYLCNCSEELDTCNIRLCRSIQSSSWYTISSPQVRCDLLMLLRRAQRPNYLRFSQGSNEVVFCRKYFIYVCKVSYSFVNFMKYMK